MRFLFAFFVPPLAILSCGKIISFVFNLIAFVLAWAFFFAAVGLFVIPFGVIAAFLLIPLGAVFWILSVVHAMFAVADYENGRRHRELLVQLRESDRLP
jgi:hypothetical protein